MQVLLESKLVNLVVVNVKFNVGFKKIYVHYIKYWGCQKLLIELECE